MRFAAAIPAIRAISSGFPFGDLSLLKFATVARRIFTKAWASATRAVAGFSVTSTNGVPESIASGLAQVTHGHYASMGIAGDIAEAMAQLAAKLGDDAARRP